MVRTTRSVNRKWGSSHSEKAAGFCKPNPLLVTPCEFGDVNSSRLLYASGALDLGGARLHDTYLKRARTHNLDWNGPDSFRVLAGSGHKFGVSMETQEQERALQPRLGAYERRRSQADLHNKVLVSPDLAKRTTVHDE